MKIPDIDLDELNKHIEEILKERIKLRKDYKKWLKKNPNKKRSSGQKKIIE